MSKLLIPNDYPVIASPQLIKLCGMAGAAFIQKLHYCLKETKVKKYQHNKKAWWKHTLDNWLEALGAFSAATIKRAITTLKNLGLIEVSQLAKNPWDRTNYYTINYAKLKTMFAKKQPDKTNTPDENKPHPTSAQPPKNLSGTQQPNQQPATIAQLQAMPVDMRRFYQQLRQQRLDICPNDPRLTHWLTQSIEIIHQIAWARTYSGTPYGWHTPEQLLLTPQK